jgi:hypothetical protein
MGSLQHTDGRRPLALRQYRPNTFTGHSEACASMERTRTNDGLRPRSRYPHQTPYQFRSKTMSKMRLTVGTLDNDVKSAIINVGKYSGYVEAYIDGQDLALYIYDKNGEVIFDRFIPIKTLQAKGGYTTPQF